MGSQILWYSIVMNYITYSYILFALHLSSLIYISQLPIFPNKEIADRVLIFSILISFGYILLGYMAYKYDHKKGEGVLSIILGLLAILGFSVLLYTFSFDMTGF